MEKKKQNSIVLFFLEMIVLYFVILGIKYLALGVMTHIVNTVYMENIIVEALCALITTLFVFKFKNIYIFNGKRMGFFKSLLVGAFPIGLATILLIGSLGEIGHVDISILLASLLFALLIGIEEEFLCRGLIQNEFIERFGKSRKGVLKSILCASLLFGAMHIGNVLTTEQGLIETLGQVIQAAGIGFLFGCIYYRTKNIWTMVFIHGYWDFSFLLKEAHIVENCGADVFDIKSLISSLLLVGLYVLIAFFIMRKSKTNNLIEKENISKEEIQESKKRSKFYIIGIIIYYIFITLIINSITKAPTCTTYEEKNIPYQEITYPVYDSYNLNDLAISFELKNTNLIVKDEILQKEIKIPNVDDFAVIEEDNRFKIFIITSKYSKNKIYYSEYLTLDTKSLDEFKKSLKVIDDFLVPSKLSYIAYRTRNYFVFESNKEKYIYYKDNVYKLNNKKEGN